MARVKRASLMATASVILWIFIIRLVGYLFSLSLLLYHFFLFFLPTLSQELLTISPKIMNFLSRNDLLPPSLPPPLLPCLLHSLSTYIPASHPLIFRAI